MNGLASAHGCLDGVLEVWERDSSQRLVLTAAQGHMGVQTYDLGGF